MFSTFINVALFAVFALQGALADFTIDTPAFIQVCIVRSRVANLPVLTYILFLVPACSSHLVSYYSPLQSRHRFSCRPMW
jgi:hypothetical protein